MPRVLLNEFDGIKLNFHYNMFSEHDIYMDETDQATITISTMSILCSNNLQWIHKPVYNGFINRSTETVYKVLSLGSFCYLL